MANRAARTRSRHVRHHQAHAIHGTLEYLEMNNSTTDSPENFIGFKEFVALMAFSMSLVALCTDGILPAFPEIASDLQVQNLNNVQLVISVLFVGLSIGMLFYGPLSDSFGRKPAMYVGFAIFICGSLMSLLAEDFPTMLAGRFLQGLGAAGPRTIATALIRDRFHGSAMAKVMSFIVTFFVLVPIISPSLGQLILLVSSWRGIFAAFLLLAAVNLVWLILRQPETLPVHRRAPFTLRRVAERFKQVLSNRQAMGYTLISGCVFGALVGYLNVSQQVFGVLYGLGAKFPLYFALIAFSIGVASLINSQIVMRFGMRRVAQIALWGLMLLSLCLLSLTWWYDGLPPLWFFMANMMVLFFFIGILFGNMNSLAMEPLGRVAGTGAAVLGSISTLVGVFLGYFIGLAYDASLYSMAEGFTLLSIVSVVIMHGVARVPVAAR